MVTFDCQAAFLGYAKDFSGVLLRLFFGAKPLRVMRLGGSGRKFNSVISHTLLSHLTRVSALISVPPYGVIPNCQNRNE